MNRRRTAAKKTPRKRGPRYMWLPKGTTLAEARLSLALGEPIPRKTPKKSTPKTARPKKNKAPATVVVEDNVGSEFYDKVNSKVDNFFKSSSLLSSDEEEETKAAKIKPINSSLTISDSDDDCLTASSSSTNVNFNQPSTSKSADRQQNIPNKSMNEDEIMQMVDSVLENTDNKANPITDMKSLEEYRKETEEMLKNASSLLDEIKATKADKVEKMKENVVDNSEEKGMASSCPICLELLSTRPKAATFCGHVFCKECIYECAKTLKKCPTCRKPISIKKIHPLFF